MNGKASQSGAVPCTRAQSSAAAPYLVKVLSSVLEQLVLGLRVVARVGRVDGDLVGRHRVVARRLRAQRLTRNRCKARTILSV